MKSTIIPLLLASAFIPNLGCGDETLTKDPLKAKAEDKNPSIFGISLGMRYQEAINHLEEKGGVGLTGKRAYEGYLNGLKAIEDKGDNLRHIGHPKGNKITIQKTPIDWMLMGFPIKEISIAGQYNAKERDLVVTYIECVVKYPAGANKTATNKNIGDQLRTQFGQSQAYAKTGFNLNRWENIGPWQARLTQQTSWGEQEESTGTLILEDSGPLKEKNLADLGKRRYENLQARLILLS